MKKLDQFILKSFIGPFFGLLIVVVFILMMQFLWLYIDELVGKGLGLRVILEFLAWGSANLLPMALPLATLLASVMTVGQMSENNELIAIKAAGISLWRVLSPIMACSVLISIGAFFAANNLVPVALNHIYTLREDIGNTKEEINIPPGTFYDGIDGYVLRINGRDDATGMMHGVMVYDHTAGKGNVSVTLADSAMMKMAKTKNYLTFQLYNGINYQETNEMKYRDTTLQLQKIEFSRQEMIIPLENYAFQKSDSVRFGDQVRTMKLPRLRHGKDSLYQGRDSVKAEHLVDLSRTRILRYANQLDTAFDASVRSPMDYSRMKWSDATIGKRIHESALASASEMGSVFSNYINDSYSYNYYLPRTEVEILKRFAQALMCLILFFIGAPLGAFVRRGALGTSAIIAVLFYLLYWVIDLTGTKLARDGSVTAVIGVFVSALVLLPIGLYLTSRAIHDASLFGTDGLKTGWRRIKSRFIRLFRRTRIVYMGTPEFAVAPLEALIKARHKVVAVVTVADKPAGRGLKPVGSAVKQYAEAQGIPVLQPLRLKDPDFLQTLASYKADLFVVVAFRMLPEEVWSMPPLGTINLHAALLPQYRGAAPINWAVINGERMSGVTTFMIDRNIDTGGIILRQECRIDETDTAGDLHDKLLPLGADLVTQTVEGLIQKNVETRVQRSFIQGSEVLKPAPKLTRELCYIDWDAPTAEVYNLIRGLSPYPAAFTTLVRRTDVPGQEAGTPLQLKIFATRKRDDLHAAPGTLLSDGKTFLAFATRDGALEVLDVQLQGKKRMDVKAFLAGFRDPESYAATPGTSTAEIAKTRPA